jgi:hypothetical protein
LVIFFGIKDYYYGFRLKSELRALEGRVVSYKEKELLSFIRRDLIDNRGLIISKIENGKPSEYSLLESYGELMEYALLRVNKDLFDILLSIVNKYFYSKDGYLYWRINRLTLMPENSTALIDSLRILNALVSAYEIFKDKKYMEMGEKISEEILKFNSSGEFFVDYYDGNTKAKANKISLFYLDLRKLKKISKLLPSFNKYYITSKNILENSVSINRPFFPKEFDLYTFSYKTHYPVNMLEQVITAINFDDVNKIEDFLSFVKNEINKYNKLNTFYMSDKRVDDQENVGLYAILARLFIFCDDELWAKKVFNFVEKFKGNDSFGYGDFWGKNYYAFDQLEVLLTLSYMED